QDDPSRKSMACPGLTPMALEKSVTPVGSWGPTSTPRMAFVVGPRRVARTEEPAAIAASTATSAHGMAARQRALRHAKGTSIRPSLPRPLALAPAEGGHIPADPRTATGPQPHGH